MGDQSAGRSGAPGRGTTATAEALAGLPPGWTVLPGRTQRRRRVIGHVAVGPGGVFVIVEPPWFGRVEVRDGVLRHNGRRAERTLRATAAAAETVARSLTGLGHQLVRPVLCVESTRRLSGVSAGVVICSPDNVAELLTTRSALLDDRAAQQLVAELDGVLAPAGSEGEERPRVPSPAGRWARALRDVALVVGALALAVMAVLNFDTVRRYVEHTVMSGSSELGTQVGLAEADGHPRLTVTALRLTEVHRRTAEADRGTRLVGVQLRMRNRGEQVLRLVPGTAVVLRPVLGKSYPAEPVRPAIREGRLLPDRLRLAPGAVVRGWVVFEVPEAAAFDQVSVRFGTDRADVARWRIPTDALEETA